MLPKVDFTHWDSWVASAVHLGSVLFEFWMDWIPTSSVCWTLFELIDNGLPSILGFNQRSCALRNGLNFIFTQVLCQLPTKSDLQVWFVLPVMWSWVDIIHFSNRANIFCCSNLKHLSTLQDNIDNCLHYQPNVWNNNGMTLAQHTESSSTLHQCCDKLCDLPLGSQAHEYSWLLPHRDHPFWPLTENSFQLINYLYVFM